MATTLKQMIEPREPQLTSGVSKFLSRFSKFSSTRSHSKLATAFHQFGWEMGTTTTLQAGQLRHGKRIAVQATAAGRRKKGKSRGKGKEVAGRPTKSSVTTQSGPSTFSSTSRHAMPTRKDTKGRRLHLLSHNIELGKQNAGKW